MTLQIIWFLLVGILLTVYALLDGFDLGVGILQRVIGRSDAERGRMIASVGPFWDGNEVWLLTGGGALFAAFPHVYATVFSGFYLAMMLVVLGLMLRAISIEFRNHVDSAGWRSAWDWIVALGSLLPALLFGVAVGNVVAGVPIDAQRNFAGTFFTLLTPYTLLVGLLGLVMFVLHGALYLNARMEPPLAGRAARVARGFWAAFVVLLLIVTGATVVSFPARFDHYVAYPVAMLVPIALVAANVYLLVSLRTGARGRAFLASCLSIACLMAVLGISIYPNMLLASNTAANSLTIFNSSSSPLTLRIMLILVVIGLPIVLAYTLFIYRTFLARPVSAERGPGSGVVQPHAKQIARR